MAGLFTFFLTLAAGFPFPGHHLSCVNKAQASHMQRAIVLSASQAAMEFSLPEMFLPIRPWAPAPCTSMRKPAWARFTMSGVQNSAGEGNRHLDRCCPSLHPSLPSHSASSGLSVDVAAAQPHSHIAPFLQVMSQLVTASAAAKTTFS
eukprot:302911-Rhodomonas_salina.1